MADAAARKRKIQDMEDRLKKVEGTVEDHSTRLDTVELRLEEQQQYRFLRVEKSKSLDKLWKEVEDGTVGRNTIRGTAARVLAEEVRTTLRSMSDAGEEALQTKAADWQRPERQLRLALCLKTWWSGFHGTAMDGTGSASHQANPAGWSENPSAKLSTGHCMCSQSLAMVAVSRFILIGARGQGRKARARTRARGKEVAKEKGGGRGSNQDGADKAGREWLGSQFDGFRGMFLGSVT